MDDGVFLVGKTLIALSNQDYSAGSYEPTLIRMIRTGRQACSGNRSSPVLE